MHDSIASLVTFWSTLLQCGTKINDTTSNASQFDYSMLAKEKVGKNDQFEIGIYD